MKNKLQELIEHHRFSAGETFHELNELNKTDLSKFSNEDQKDLQISIAKLSAEYELRRIFVNDLETLL